MYSISTRSANFKIIVNTTISDSSSSKLFWKVIEMKQEILLKKNKYENVAIAQ